MAAHVWGLAIMMVVLVYSENGIAKDASMLSSHMGDSEHVYHFNGDDGDEAIEEGSDVEESVDLENRRDDSGPGPRHGRPYRCYLPPARGPCGGFFLRYHFNHLTNTCKRFSYGGCGGNANRFHTINGCLRVCRY